MKEEAKKLVCRPYKGGKPICTLCNTVMTSDYIERWISHLRHCSNADNEIKSKFKITRVREYAPQVIGVTVSETTIDRDEKEELDMLFSDFVFSTNSPFSIADAPSLTRLVKKLRPNYQVPCSRTVGTTQLEERYAECVQKIKEFTDKSGSICITTDGWSNINGQHLVNFIALTPAPVFLGSINTTGISQTGEQIATDIMKTIKQLGTSKVTSVVTDNCPSMRKAWKIVGDAFKGIFCNGCAAHCLNLLSLDILNLDDNMDVMKKGIRICEFVRHSSFVLNKFRTFQEISDVNGELVLPVKTRWSSNHQCLKRVLHNRDVLMDVASCTLVKNMDSDSAVAFRSIMNDAAFWLKVGSLEADLSHVALAVAQMESDNASVSEVYATFGKLLKELKGERYRGIILERWKFIKTDAIGFAWMSDPKTRFGKYFFK
jgi:hypothetical protein